MLINQYKYTATIQQFKNTVSSGLDTTAFHTKNASSLLGSDGESSNAASSMYGLAAESSSDGAKFSSNLLLDLTNQIHDSQYTVNAVLSNLLIPDEVAEKREEKANQSKKYVKDPNQQAEANKNQKYDQNPFNDQNQNQTSAQTQNNNPFTQNKFQNNDARLVRQEGVMKEYTKYIQNRTNTDRNEGHGNYADHLERQRQHRENNRAHGHHGQRDGNHGQRHGHHGQRSGNHGNRFGNHGHRDGHHGQRFSQHGGEHHGQRTHAQRHEGNKDSHRAETRTVSKKSGGKGKKGSKTVTKKVKSSKPKPAPKPIKNAPKPKIDNPINNKPTNNIPPEKPIDKKPINPKPINPNQAGKQPQPADNKANNADQLKDKLNQANKDQNNLDNKNNQQKPENDPNKTQDNSNPFKNNNSNQAKSSPQKVTVSKPTGSTTSVQGGGNGTSLEKVGGNSIKTAANNAGMPNASRADLLKLKEEMDALSDIATVSLKALEQYTSSAEQKFKTLREEALSMSLIASKQALAGKSKNLDPSKMSSQDKEKQAQDKKMISSYANSYFSFA
ncbi:MAG: hypothetical protein AB1782_10000 [Cyanobacteriota bacterium]